MVCNLPDTTLKVHPVKWTCLLADKSLECHNNNKYKLPVTTTSIIFAPYFQTIVQDMNNFEINPLRTALFCVITQPVAVISYRRFERTYWSHLQGSRILNLEDGTTWTLKIGPIGCPKMSVRNYHYSLCNNPEECSSHLLHSQSLKSSSF